jgi:SPP1 gp7 family putative phage head morphogenesis protein
MTMVKIDGYRLIQEDKLDGMILNQSPPINSSKSYRLVKESFLDGLILVNKLGPLPKTIIEDNSKAFTKVMDNIKKDLEVIADKSENLADFKDRVGLYVKVNPMTTEANMASLLDAVNKVGGVFEGQMKGTPMGGTAQLAKEVVRNDSTISMTKLGEDVQSSIRNIIEQGVNNNKSMESIRDEMTQNIDSLSKNRAEVISRTESARAYNQAEKEKAQNEGKEYFVVVSTPECCEDCFEAYDGNTFHLPEDEDMLPPFHPNCMCTASFFRTEEQASDMSDEVSHDRPEFTGDETG